MIPLVLIPARGGSKGVPRKNIKELNGKPLIHYTIEEARKIFSDSDICVSTDDLEILDSVKQTGLRVPFIRPADLATDTASTHSVIMHALNFAESNGKTIDFIVILQPTSPFRNARHINEALALFNSELEMVVSVKETSSNPYFVLFEENEAGYLIKSKEGKFTRRQDCPKVWEYNGAIYIINARALREKPVGEFSRIKKYVMDEYASHDIDTMLDWRIAEVIAKEFVSRW